MDTNKNTLAFWLFLLPVILAFSLVVVVPFFTGIYYSFTDWKGLNDANFVGIGNYQKLITDKAFLDSIIFTGKFAIVTVICVNVISLALALLVTQKMFVSNALRTVFFMPNLIGGLILGFIWQFIYLGAFPELGWGHWTSTPTTAFWGLVILSTWQMSSYMMVIYVAYLQNVPSEILEAASMDGVTPWQKFVHIIFPLIAPGFTVSTFMTLSNSFKLFDQNLSLTGGGPFNSSTMVALEIYKTAYAQNEMAYAQSKAVIFFLIILVLSFTQTYFSRKREVEV